MISKIHSVEYAHEAIVDSCIGCARVVKGENVCEAYLYPKAKWKLGNCNASTHIIEVIDDSKKTKTRVGQQKQKKRG